VCAQVRIAQLRVLFIETVDLYMQQNEDAARDAVRAGCELARKASAEKWLLLFEMRQAVLSRRISKASELFRQVEQSLRTGFVDVAIFVTKAESLVFSENPETWEEAANLLEDAQVRSKRHPFLYWLSTHRLADVLANLKQFTHSEETGLAAIGMAKTLEEAGIDPSIVAVSCSNLGITMFEQGLYLQAFRYFRKANEIDTKNKYSVDEINLAFLGFFIADEFSNVLSQKRIKQTFAFAFDTLKKASTEDRVTEYNAGLLELLGSKFPEAAVHFRKSADFSLSKEANIQHAFSGAITGYLMSKIATLEMEYARGGRPDEDRVLSEQDQNEAIAARHFFKAVSRDARLFIPAMLNELELHRQNLARKPSIVTEEKRNQLVVLRRWNSYTPSIPLPPGRRGIGGGYFLNWRGKGIVIDPGFNFVQNLYDQDFCLADIDAIVLTHAHIDHTAEFDPLMTLLYEKHAEEKRRQKGARQSSAKGIYLLLNVGSSLKELGWLSHLPPDLIARIDIMWPGNKVSIGEYITVEAVKGYHDEILTKEYSIGLKVHVRDRKNAKQSACVLGITSDTRWNSSLVKAFSGCDILIAHLGSASFKEIACAMRIPFSKEFYDKLVLPSDDTAPVLDDEKCELLGFTSKERFKQVFVDGMPCDPHIPGDHLGFLGTYRLAEEFRGDLFIISEFGEELGPFRTKVAATLNYVLNQQERDKPFKALTGDVGLTVLLSPVKVRCEVTKSFVPPHSILENCLPFDEKRIAYFSRSIDYQQVWKALKLHFEGIGSEEP